MLNRSFANGARGRRPRRQGTYARPVDPVAGAAPGSGQGGVLLSATCRSAEPGALSHQEQYREGHHHERFQSKKDSTPKLDRRNFLAAAAVAGAASAVNAAADAHADAPAVRSAPAAPAVRAAAERPCCRGRNPARRTSRPIPREGRPGSDFMVDVIKTLDIKYLPSNPASSYRAIHESLINYGKNTMPEFLTCMHEESGVGMATATTRSPASR